MGRSVWFSILVLGGMIIKPQAGQRLRRKRLLWACFYRCRVHLGNKHGTRASDADTDLSDAQLLEGLSGSQQVKMKTDSTPARSVDVRNMSYTLNS